MIAPATLTLLALAVLATSFLSGIFGMAGGIILLGVLMLVLDVGQAMVLFGSTQMAANGWRATLWQDHIYWRVVAGYCLGALAAFLVMRLIAYVPSKAFMYLALGSMPFLADLLPKRLEPDITRPGMPIICGAILTVLNLLAGATGTLLDVFFQKSALDRKSIVATKAVTQTFAHLLRIFYFGSLMTAFDVTIPWWVYAGAVIPAIVGTTLAARVLEAMTDADFRRWARRIILAVSLTFIARGLWLLAAS
ncbi:MAG TPA: TSUP family transporter [Hyphomicrobiaceae bacterium]|nr:TSUP family transporter [Hyphomicrobiaceae bacterium]